MDNRASGSALDSLPDVPKPLSNLQGLQNDFPGDVAYVIVGYIPSSGKETPIHFTLSKQNSVNYDFRKLYSNVFSSSICTFWILLKTAEKKINCTVMLSEPTCLRSYSKQRQHVT